MHRFVCTLVGGRHESAGFPVHWSVFTVSLANLVLIAVMVLIFAAALLLPFPGHPPAR